MIIDAHLHFLKRDGFLHDLLRDMDAAGVEKSILAALPPLGFLNAVTGGNDDVLAAAETHPDRLIAFGYVDPRDTDAPDAIARLADRGVRGFKLFPPVGYRVDDALFAPVFDAIAETKLPVLIHCGQTNLDWADAPHTRPVNSALAHPSFVDQLTRLHPDTTFIIAHMGFPHLMEAWVLAMANPNVILDLAGGPGWPWPWVDVYNHLGRPVPIDWKRVWWGTDNCMPPAESLPFARQRLAEAGCPEHDLPSITGDCAANLLKL